MLLDGKKALITGGTQGIGMEIVKKYLLNGADVYIISLDEGQDLDSLKALASENGRTLELFLGNVADESQMNDLVAQILEKSGGIDILVNNAGITKDGLLFGMKSEDWDLVLKVNLSSMFYISKPVIRAMVKKKIKGSIINMASVVGIQGNPGQANYVSSKAGAIGLTKTLAREFGSRSIRANAIAPGFIVTPMTDKLNDKQKDAIIAQIPMKDLGQPEDIADMALFLGSDMSKYVTGQVMSVDGGMAM